ncbi:anhydro-N-acetylmuramic acid kinase [Aquincola sp. S2]|uniref:Anhydro-N-acetylmuramic acid kinase n=1 Tax=Pseudaquabacterium terrae TaxID=2732868 RepID=A0ABX2ECA7_9BURK|nr:anhydro-N-acetylmuramic acid kinase [Aquabacterium terrae]NRF66555.1 anhydro-N-acetylmuramic acid kinase [Aquabacterium terrae]
MGASEWYIGLMSGTSLDGVDAVLAAFPSGAPMQVRGHVHGPLPEALRHELLALNARGDDELHRAALAANGIAEVYATAVRTLLVQTGCDAAAVRAIGAHGQTVRHRPGEFDGVGYTCQLLNGALLAERCGIDVVCDLRSRDVAAGGQGAPLVPAFHAARFGRPGEALAVLNIGGIANLSLLHADGRVGGFDCGPGNALMDLWCQRQRGLAFDDDGRWSATGAVHPALLAHWLAEPYFERAPPKSTGRDLFTAAWLDAGLATYPRLEPSDVQATLTELTARCAASALQRHAAATTRLLVCGGGALNGHLMRRLAALLPDVTVGSTADAGLPPLQVEAAAFAWLAQAFVERRPGNRPEVTGARSPRLLGALYPAA